MMLDALRYLSDGNNKIARAQLAVAYQNEVLRKGLDWNTLLLLPVENYLPAAFLEKLEELTQGVQHHADSERGVKAESFVRHDLIMQLLVKVIGNAGNVLILPHENRYIIQPYAGGEKTVHLFTEELRLMPLYELLEELFSIFEMNRISDQDAYLFAFFARNTLRPILYPLSAPLPEEHSPILPTLYPFGLSCSR